MSKRLINENNEQDLIIINFEEQKKELLKQKEMLENKKNVQNSNISDFIQENFEKIKNEAKKMSVKPGHKRPNKRGKKHINKKAALKILAYIATFYFTILGLKTTGENILDAIQLQIGYNKEIGPVIDSYIENTLSRSRVSSYIYNTEIQESEVVHFHKVGMDVLVNEMDYTTDDPIVAYYLLYNAFTTTDKYCWYHGGEILFGYSRQLAYPFVKSFIEMRLDTK